MCRSSIALIEPDVSQRLLYELELTDAGYDVAAYSDPRHLGAHHSCVDPAVVVLDAGSCTSVAASRVRAVRRAYPDVPLVVHTASLFVEPMGDAFFLKTSDLMALKKALYWLTDRETTMPQAHTGQTSSVTSPAAARES